MAKNTELVKREAPQALAVPEYLQGYGGKGLEGVQRGDMTLPRLSIAQSGSPAYKKANPNHIDGIEEGDLYNSLTRAVYGAAVVAVPLVFFKGYIKFRSMDEGGGVLGMKTTSEGIRPADLEFGADGEKPVWTVLYNFLCYLPETKELIVVSMKSTASKVAKNWTSLMRLLPGVPAFGRKYKVRTVPASSAKGDYFNFQVDPMQFALEAEVKMFDGLYEGFKGQEIKMDTTDLHEEATETSEESPF